MLLVFTTCDNRSSVSQSRPCFVLQDQDQRYAATGDIRIELKAELDPNSVLLEAFYPTARWQHFWRVLCRYVRDARAAAQVRAPILCLPPLNETKPRRAKGILRHQSMALTPPNVLHLPAPGNRIKSARIGPQAETKWITGEIATQLLPVFRLFRHRWFLVPFLISEFALVFAMPSACTPFI